MAGPPVLPPIPPGAKPSDWGGWDPEQTSDQKSQAGRQPVPGIYAPETGGIPAQWPSRGARPIPDVLGLSRFLLALVIFALVIFFLPARLRAWAVLIVLLGAFAANPGALAEWSKRVGFVWTGG